MVNKLVDGVNGVASSSTSQDARVLSIQSHVTYGYVGGKAAVFPLQCMGFDVDVINTVNFSNHSGYGHLGGTKTSAEELERIIASMKHIGLLRPDRLLTGYTSSAEALQVVHKLAADLRQINPDLVYLLDPVLGDSGKLYVSPETVPVYRAMLPLATVITPNWFEVEVLTDIKMSDMFSLRAAIQKLHDEYHVPNVVISSIPLRQWLIDSLPESIRPPQSADEDAQYLLCISSSATGPSTVHARCVPLIPGYFSGVGDLFSALLLGHFIPPSTKTTPLSQPGDSAQTALSRATSAALAKTHALLALTDEYTRLLPEDERIPTDEERDKVDPVPKFRRMRGRELRLIQGQHIFRQTELRPDEQMQEWAGFW
ncbi:bud site selection protein 16 [Coniophora puteana RWD-64-598 SS2]|uniref:pyridoxal kinase n=1 Tax=Coniophora puteana (strain RWD-64-598) TaxID=741705 RepID=A0A5M3M932_CONPW|nr:bud site selection protein 16 [Coniophora puteana RWD-64-598 SS2]EIW75151.1 bud site selection protein 16 [Coniophora puteana RWD-64-598 SS2]